MSQYSPGQDERGWVACEQPTDNESIGEGPKEKSVSGGEVSRYSSSQDEQHEGVGCV